MGKNSSDSDAFGEIAGKSEKYYLAFTPKDLFESKLVLLVANWTLAGQKVIYWKEIGK